MWYFNNIPKILHLYWGTSNPLSYLRYLTVETFHKQNPDWKIQVYYCSERIQEISWTTKENSIVYSGDDYFLKLKSLDYVTLIEENFGGSFLAGKHDVHKSDYVRWKRLYEFGGFWSDFDILYIAPISTIVENKYDNSNIDSILCTYDKNRSVGEVFPIGFFGGNKNNKIFYECFRQSELVYKHNRYESIGAKLLRKIIYKHNFKYLKISDICVYPIFYTELATALNNSKISFNEGTIGFHWYAGSNLVSGIEADTDLTNNFLSKVFYA